MARLFLSYSSANKEFARKLSADLRSVGIEVWLDEWEIRVGDDIRRKIDHGITSYEYFGIVLSPESVSSPWVNSELSAAFMREIEQRRVIILPIKIADVEIPPLISGKRYADFTSSYESGFSSLTDVLRAVHLKNYQQLQDRQVVTARRGAPTEPRTPSRIGTCIYGGDEWCAVALIESVGDLEAARLATSVTGKMLNAMFSTVQVIDPHELISGSVFDLIDRGIKYERAIASMPLSQGAGTSLALIIQVRQKAFVACVGRCGGIFIRYMADESVAFMRIENKESINFQIPKDDPSGAWGYAPLGYLSENPDHEFTIEPIQVPMANCGDTLVLTSFSIPWDTESMYKKCKPSVDSRCAQSIAKIFCETHSPVDEDCMAVVLTRTAEG